MLRARAPRRLPGALRRGLTFWRRSIQARVVASTVHPHRGRHRRGRLAAAAADPRRPARPARPGRSPARWPTRCRRPTSGSRPRPGRTPTRPCSGASSTDLIIQRGATRGYGVVVAGPAGEGVRIADGGTDYSSRFSTAQRPGVARGALRRDRAPAPRGPTPRSPRTDGDDQVISHEPGIAVGCPGAAAGRRQHLHASTSCSRWTSSRTRWGWWPGPCSPPVP